MALGQKNSVVKGISTSTTSPPKEISCFNLISGTTLAIFLLNINESLANMLFDRFAIVDASELPSTDVITCLNLVVNSGTTSEPIFLLDSISFSINFSSPPLRTLNVTLVFEIGN